jgi:LPS-assembly protein
MRRKGDIAGRGPDRAPLGFAAIAAALAVSVGAAASAQTPTSAPAEQTSPVLLEADELITDDAARTVTAQGDVQVRYQGRTLRADQLVYNLDTGVIRAIGNVQVVLEDGSVTYAEEVEADEAMNVGAASELRARLGATGTLAARSVIRRGEDQSELRNVIYTSCPICEDGDRPPTWSLRARRAVQDRDSRTISYQGAVLEVVGIPLLYLPFMAHPDPSVGRASGFLPPALGRTRRLGVFYEQPYYWAISPSQDFVASLRLHETVNPLLGFDYRKRFWSGSVSFDGTMTQEELFDDDGDRLGDERFRFNVFGSGSFDISEHWRWGFGLETVYDDQYLRRYGINGAGERRGPYIGQETRLISQLFAIGQDEDSYTSIAFVNFQGLRETDTSEVLPLILPLASTEHVFTDPLLDGQVRLQANLAALARNDDAATLDYLGNDARLSLAGTWRRDLVFGPGLVASPFAQARGDLFSVETEDGEYETFSRALGLAGAEISWPFMRPGESFDVIVEPVVMAAVASEDAEDDRIINEDSLAFELDDSNLFRPNAAPNYDLWEPGPRVSVGLRATARAVTGENASLLFGRRWRDEGAEGFNDANNLAGSTSDWVAAGQLDLGRHFGATARVRLEEDSLAVQRIDLSARGAVGRFNASARYFDIDEDVQLSPDAPNSELSANIGVELARGWRAQFGVVRDLDSDINLRQDIRAIYEDDCTFLEIAYTRSETSRGTIGPNEGLQIRIGLRSLGVFGGS